MLINVLNVSDSKEDSVHAKIAHGKKCRKDENRGCLHGLGGSSFGNIVLYISFHLSASVCPGNAFFLHFSCIFILLLIPSTGSEAFNSHDVMASMCSSRMSSLSKVFLHLWHWWMRWCLYRWPLDAVLAC